MSNVNAKLKRLLVGRIDNWRLSLVEFIAGDMPVLLNITVTKPSCHKGNMMRFDGSEVGLIRPHIRLVNVNNEPLVMTRGLENEAK